MTRPIIALSTLCSLLLFALTCTALPANAEGDAYDAWIIEAAANGDETTARAYAEHQARLGEVRPLIRMTFPESPDLAVIIAACESGMTPTAMAGPFWYQGRWVVYSGLFQIDGGLHGYSHAALTDPVVNIAAARLIYDRAGGFGPWPICRFAGHGGW